MKGRHMGFGHHDFGKQRKVSNPCDANANVFDNGDSTGEYENEGKKDLSYYIPMFASQSLN
jgi:hypothetical protein